MSLSSYFRSAPEGPSAADTAVELGASARRLYDDWKASEIDAFALRLAAEKAGKGATATVGPSPNIKVGGNRGGMKTSSRVKKGKKGLKGDLGIMPTNPSVVPTSFPRTGNVRIPKRFRVNQTLITTSTTAITESNYVVALNNLTNYTNLVGEFDQYQIWSIEVAIQWNVPPGGVAADGQVYSAIDFDNTANLGSLAALEDYDTCKVMNLKPGAVTRRSCRPCVATSVGSSALGGVQRCWIDSAYPTVSHYGLRFIIDKTGVALTGIPVLTVNVWFARSI